MKTNKMAFVLCFLSQCANASNEIKSNHDFLLNNLFPIDPLFVKKDNHIAPVNFLIEKLVLVENIYRDFHIEYTPNEKFQEQLMYGHHLSYVDKFKLSTTPMYYFEINNNAKIGFTYFPEFLAHSLIDSKESFFFSINYDF